MIDLHSHILPDVDDGPSDWDGALAMMAMADEAGTTVLVATPHSHDFWRAETPPAEAIPALVREANVRAKAAGLKLTIMPGQECQAVETLVSDLKTGICRLLGDSRTVLMELPFSLWPPHTEALIFDLQLAGYTVLLAHPERYAAVLNDPTRVLPLVECGVLMQVSTTSVLGRSGPRVLETVQLLVEHGQAHVLASDAHTTRGRPPVLTEARATLAEWIGEEAAQRMVLDTPFALLTDEAPTLPEPQPIVRSRKKLFGVF